MQMPEQNAASAFVFMPHSQGPALRFHKKKQL
jgi:hypothetical protein